MFYLRFFIIGILFACFTVKGFVSESTDLRSSVQVRATPFNDFNRDDVRQRYFGALQFRGGLELSSSDPVFGGISALYIQPDGEHFIALSDRAYWLGGRIVYDGNRPVGLADTEMAPVMGPGGKHAKNWDTEAIAVNGDRLYMGVEGIDRIPYFIFTPPQFPVFQDTVSFPPGGKELPRNRGLEALVCIQKKKTSDVGLWAFSEKGLDKNGNLIAYIMEDTEIKEFAVKRCDEYDISDAVFLPDGDVLILERKFETIKGVSMRLRRIPASQVRPGALVDGPVVIEADVRYQVDNMEAIAAHRDVSGETILTLISDDNYSKIQKTLLLQFAYRK